MNGRDEITQILSSIEAGTTEASDRLLPLVYDELRKLAAQQLATERPGQTLQPTALVHEAYLRLVGSASPVSWDHRGHFFAAAAEAMRRILIDAARRKRRRKHGGEVQRVDLPVDEICEPVPDERLLAIDAVLEQLEQEFPEKAAVVRLRFYAGLTNEETARALGISTATAQRHWTFSRAWLFSQLQDRE